MGAVQVRQEPPSAALVRERLRADLDAAELAPESADAVLLVATELVANAIRHAQPAGSALLDVQWDVDGDTVTVRVADSSVELPRRRFASINEPAGRGLAIVEAIAESWGADVVGEGKQVWARVCIERDGARSAQMA